MENENNGMELGGTILIPQPAANPEFTEPIPKAGQTEYYKPIGQRVLIEPYTISSTNTFQGLIVPTDQDKPTNIGVIREIGTAFLEARVRDFYPFDIGSTVVFNPSGAIEILKDGKRFFIVDLLEVIAVKEIRDLENEKQMHDVNSIPAGV